MDNSEGASKARLWREARTSIAWGLLVLLACGAGLACFVRSMPKLQVGMVVSACAPWSVPCATRRDDAARARRL